MIDQPKASKLAREGYDLWQSGQLNEAVLKYREAFDYADPDHFGLSHYHGELAAILTLLNQPTEALEEYKISLELELLLANAEEVLAVTVSRYFLGQHLLNMGNPLGALSILEPSFSQPGNMEWHMRELQAECYWCLSRNEGAEESAKLALALVPVGEKRELLEERLKNLKSIGEMK
jgi:tetratricopeptide (TPR) repeat protein